MWNGCCCPPWIRTSNRLPGGKTSASAVVTVPTTRTGREALRRLLHAPTRPFAFGVGVVAKFVELPLGDTAQAAAEAVPVPALFVRPARDRPNDKIDRHVP